MGQAKATYGKWAPADPPFTRDDLTRMFQTTKFSDPSATVTFYLPNKKFLGIFGKKEKETVKWETDNIGEIDIIIMPIQPKDL